MRGFFICIYVFFCILFSIFLVILREYPEKARTLEQYPKIRDFSEHNQEVKKVTTLQNFTEQYRVFQNSTKDIAIHYNTLDTLQNNLIHYASSITKQHNEQQHNTKGTTKDMAKNTVITLRISEELQATIQAIASKEEIPASYIIRRLIKAGLNAEGKHLASQVKATQLPDWE